MLESVCVFVWGYKRIKACSQPSVQNGPFLTATSVCASGWLDINSRVQVCENSDIFFSVQNCQEALHLTPHPPVWPEKRPRYPQLWRPLLSGHWCHPLIQLLSQRPYTVPQQQQKNFQWLDRKHDNILWQSFLSQEYFILVISKLLFEIFFPWEELSSGENTAYYIWKVTFKMLLSASTFKIWIIVCIEKFIFRIRYHITSNYLSANSDQQSFKSPYQSKACVVSISSLASLQSRIIYTSSWTKPPCK